MTTPTSFFCCLLCLFLALANLFFAVQNLFGYYLGSVGQKFIYEMDVVFGSLLNVKNYSKIEGILLLFAAIGELFIFSNDEYYIFISVMLMQLANIYYLLAIVYSFLTRQHFGIRACLILLDLTVTATVWRCNNDLNWEKYGRILIYFSVFELIFCGMLALKMKRRASFCENIIKKWLAINKFTLNNEDFVWLQGKSEPEGFSYKSRKVRKKLLKPATAESIKKDE